jgi:hypothetical protein
MLRERHGISRRCVRVTCATFLTLSAFGIDCDGFDLRADGELLRFDFDQPASSAVAAWNALIAAAKKARAA